MKIKEMWLIYERLQAEPNLSKMVIACHSQEFKIQSAILRVAQRMVRESSFNMTRGGGMKILKHEA